MVQLKDDSSEASENSTVIKAPEEQKPLWPYLLLTVAIALLAIGAHFIQKTSPDGKLPCPFHAAFGSLGNLKNPHNPISDNPVPSNEQTEQKEQAEQTEQYDSTLYSEELVYGSKKKLANVYRGRVVTKPELAEHGPSSERPWVAVLGQIYDVAAGKRHYGDGGSYHFFAGKDGSRAYSTGQFDDEGLIDDITGTTVQQIGEIYHWINIFSKKYPFVGRLEGPFFTAGGLPTAHWREVEDSLSQLSALEKEKGEVRRKFPSCNSHYDQGAGKAEVWCTEKSGGISRDWVGNPRQLHLPGETVRCACIQESLLDDPKLKEYPNCESTSTSCMIKLN